LLNNDLCRGLAGKGKLFGRKRLKQVGTLFTPDTMLRWYRQLVANEWGDHYNRKEKKSVRQEIRQVIVDLTVKFAKENAGWGWDRISGAYSDDREHICDATMGNILDPKGQSLVGHRVNNDVEAYRVGPAYRKLLVVLSILSLAFPAVCQIIVVA